MWSLGQASTGAVDGPTYNPADLVSASEDGIRTPGGSASFGIPLLSGQANGVVVFNHNLRGGVNIAFSGLGTIVAPAVPPNNIPLGAFKLFAETAAPGSTTMTVTNTGGLPVIMQIAIVGLFRDVRTPPPDSDYSYGIFSIPNSGEYGGPDYDLKATARDSFGGTILMTTAEVAIMTNAFLASKNNSLPTAVILDENVNDVIIGKWVRFKPRTKHRNQSSDIHTVDFTMSEWPREEHPT